MDIRHYSKQTDLDSILRVWHEIGWGDRSDRSRCEMVELGADLGRCLVGVVDGELQCLAADCPGTMRYQDKDLTMAGITAVCAGLTVRKQNVASRLTAALVAEEAANGVSLSVLGVFDHGYYDRLGFGSGTYDHWVSFDPKLLKAPPLKRRPCRLELDDWREVHECRVARRKQHGYVTLHPPETTRASILRGKGSFGLGFRDGDGKLACFMWITASNREVGPYRVHAMAYETHGQLVELLSVIKSLDDQVRVVKINEPPDVQLQGLIATRLRSEHMSQGSQFEQGVSASCHWQARMDDVPACVAKTTACAGVEFNLCLRDPIVEFLAADAEWRGVGGHYVVRLGDSSRAEMGTDESLPTLTASVNAFTRLWLGVRPASGLAVTDDLYGPVELLDQLDRALGLPTPRWDWLF